MVVGVAIYLLLGLLTTEDRTARDYLNTIRTGGINSRWQAAYELVKVLAEEKRQGQITPGFVPELIRVFEASQHDDPRIRRYLVRAMQMVPDPALVPVLIGTLDDSDAETRFFAVVSLGAQGDSRAVAPLIETGKSDDAGIRTVVLQALGRLKDERIRPVLIGALKDDVPQVRWNAALQLAQAGGTSGLSVLKEMLDREYVWSLEGWAEDSRVNAVVQAIRAVGMLRATDLKPTLERLRDNDPNLKIQQAAIEVLKAWQP